MKTARAVNKAELNAIAESFTGHNADRNKYIWLIGTNLGLRISELLSLRIKDVTEQNGRIRNDIVIASKYTKTKKTYHRYLSTKNKELIKEWLAILESKGYNKSKHFLFPKSKTKPISRYTAYRAIANASKALNLSGTVSCHSMRKTYATTALKYLSQQERQGTILNAWLETCRLTDHKNPTSLMAYIGTNKQIHMQAMEYISELQD